MKSDVNKIAKESLKEAEIWDKKSATFPRYDRDDIEVAKCLATLERLGLDVGGKDVLELGCGTGRYGLTLAPHAHHIYELDISSGMLGVLQESAKEHGIDNVSTICSDFGALDFTATFGRDRMPITFVAMTPAIDTKEALLKALEHTDECLAYIGLGSKRESALLDTLYKEHGVSFSMPGGIESVLAWLREEGYKEPKYTYITSIDEYDRDFDYTIKGLAWFMEVAGAVPKLDVIKRHAREYITRDKQGNEIVNYTVEKELGIALIDPRKG